MIKIGLTTWSEHPSLLNKKKVTLAEYASKLPVVEIDSSFYGIPQKKTTEKWVRETPANFQFLIKAHQSMTLHSPWGQHFSSERDMYAAYFAMLQPLLSNKRLSAVLCQFPASFDCTREAVIYLKRLRKIFRSVPLAIEFRHPSWYEDDHLAKTVAFMQGQELTLLTVDAPQVPGHSVPFYPLVTNLRQAIFRLHGRYEAGWLATGADWRKERTLYRYNLAELTTFAQVIREVEQQVGEVVVIFNNNSGGDAAENALALKELLGINYAGLNPEQIELF